MPSNPVLTMLGVVGVVLALDASATAGPPPPANPPDGYVVVVGGIRTATHNSRSRGVANCPAGTVPLSGGVVAAASDTVSTSEPDGTRWVAEVNNPTNVDTSFVVDAVCAKKPPLYAVVPATASDPAGSHLSLAAVCPAGKPLGGGASSGSTSTAVSINSSFPQGGAWIAGLNNASNTSTSVSAFAVCGNLNHYAVAAGPAISIPAGAIISAQAACPAGTVPIGGGSASSPSLGIDMTATAPTANDGSWIAREHNDGLLPALIVGEAVCASA
jgi:hypothetical protein